ncbi:hypothetical protein C5F59_008400 [Streptomyces sp. QL37]|uniref:mycothiol-dependent nitroreductase Rv2466c family protein n=1 Tax=Streptomyces sp. QL37 TaxID=2093747 RepID=UPI0035C0F4EA
MPAAPAEAAQTYDEAVRHGHDRGRDPAAGSRVGTPAIHLDGTVPVRAVLSSIPRGAEAAPALRPLSRPRRAPGFFELRSERTGGLDLG